jgi:hypothetical protein
VISGKVIEKMLRYTRMASFTRTNVLTARRKTAVSSQMLVLKMGWIVVVAALCLFGSCRRDAFLISMSDVFIFINVFTKQTNN